MKSVLFLHMGPGLNAFPERVLLGATLPTVDFWDQPAIATPTKSFSYLIQAVIDKIEFMYTTTGAPISIMAHSFGGHLTTHALREVGTKVSDCEFLCTGYDLPGGFLQLLHRLKDDVQTNSDLKSEIERYLNSQNGSAQAKEIWDYIGLLVRDPAFMRLYWPSAKLHQCHSQIAIKGPQLDASTFQYVLADFMNSVWTEQPEASSWSGQIKIHLGTKDPLLDVEREAGLWKRIYSQAKIQIHNNSGHYLHLEDALNKIHS